MQYNAYTSFLKSLPQGLCTCYGADLRLLELLVLRSCDFVGIRLDDVVAS